MRTVQIDRIFKLGLGDNPAIGGLTIMRIIELIWAVIGPLLGIVAAWKLFAVLLSRIKRNTIRISKAFWTYLITLSFPIGFLIVVGILSTITNMLYMPRKPWMASVWNGDGALGPIFIGAGLFVITIGFTIAFCLALVFLSDRSKVAEMQQDKGVSPKVEK
jgi:hypothetical protein